ncbi:MAG: DUF2232 domain-containing protein [Bdellovibrionales bacterium]|nr:DUF2232 domain-containing protein [Bdellovibrionales bacterium]
MTALTYVFGAPPFKILRAKLGRVGFWALGTILAIAATAYQPMFGVMMTSLIVLIGVFGEMEEDGFGFAVSAGFTLLICSLLSSAAFAIWVSKAGAKWSSLIVTGIETAFKPVLELNPGVEINYYDLMLQLPSVILAFWMGAIYLAVVLEPRLNGGEPASPRSAATRTQLFEYRLPDPVVWLFTAALLGSFGGFGPVWLEAIARNVLTVTVMLFFFQGISVAIRFFETMRAHWFWQTLIMVVLVVQLWPLVILLGLLDFWLDFRTRLSKRAEQFKSDEV